MKPHNFSESLAKSHAAEDLPVWEEIYRQAFPTFAAMVSHRDDGWHQRAGVDRSVILQNSKRILIDEKARFRNKKTGIVYEDVALEYWSAEAEQSPGWVCKSLLADYIAYAIVPLGRGYLLPVIQMQEAWAKNGEEWKSEYKIIRAPNEMNGYEWTTVSVGVPVDKLFKAIGACLRVEFVPLEEADANGATP
ncbi:hypothetical protein LCGC14_3132300 [marine sediment metagenome]|uniref:Uncharacterized protein n=1 Tax=marine sediment metagenome TaxID=412755 RepID=A0A0F8VZB9_9ZZZZ